MSQDKFFKDLLKRGKEIGRKSESLGEEIFVTGQKYALWAMKEVLVTMDALKISERGLHKKLAPRFKRKGGMTSGPADFLELSRDRTL